MATTTYSDDIAAPAGTGSQAYTGVGFQPKAVIFYFSDLTSFGSLTHSVCGIGIATSNTSQASVSYVQRNNVNPTQAGNRHSNTNCISFLGNANTLKIEASLTSMDADGFTLNWTTTSTGILVTYYAIGGADVTSATIKEFTTPAGTGVQAYTGVGFQSTGLFFIGKNFTTAPPATDNTIDASIMSGFCDSSLNQWSNSIVSADAVATTNSSNLCSSTSAISMPALNEGTNYLGAVSAIGADGFSINWATTAGAGAYFWALCLNGPRTKCGTITEPLGTGSQATSGVGIETVRGVLFSGTNNTAAGTSTAATLFHMGGLAGTGEMACAVGEADNSAAPIAVRRRHVQVSISQINTSGTVVGEASKTSLDADGWTLNWTTASGTARLIGYLAMGDIAPASGAVGGFKGSLLLVGVGG